MGQRQIRFETSKSSNMISSYVARKHRLNPAKRPNGTQGASPKMKLSTDRILTTHVGSLPRPQDVVDLIFAQDRGEPYDQAKFDAVGAARRATMRSGNRRKSASISSSDGEMSKISYATYIRHRLTGFEGDSSRPTPQDLDDFPDYRDKLVKEATRPNISGPSARVRSR